MASIVPPSPDTQPDRAPTRSWGLRRDEYYPMVTTGPGDTITISQRGFSGAADITISRTDARLLAKRINQCLDATRRR